jgi:spore germination cell wall hydrolase CwlJ-like protein
VKTELRLLAAVAAGLLVPATVSGSTFVIPQLSPRETAPEPVAPEVSLTIPRYELTQLDRETIAACLILEAASQGDYGMRAVMAVIRNRARGLPELFVPTVLRPKQFSALNQATSGRESLWRSIQRAKRDMMWPTALQIVDDALDSDWHDPTEGATHYTRSAERTRWTRSLAKTVTIGAHSFYR